MNTGKTRFQAGNQMAKLKAGKQHKTTVVKEKLGLKNLQELEADLINTWYELLHSKNKNDKRFAVKEISKYVFPVKKEVSHTGFTIEDYILSITQIDNDTKELESGFGN